MHSIKDFTKQNYPLFDIDQLLLEVLEKSKTKSFPIWEGITMGKGNKSKRFIQQSSDSVTKYSEKFPYHFTLAEAEERKANNRQSFNA